MEKKIAAFVTFVFNNFGPLVVFYGANHFFGLKPAIGLSTGYSLLEIGFKLWRKEPITGIFKYTAIMTVVFGCVDLYAKQSFLFKFEGAVTNVFTAIFFGATLFSEKTIIADYYLKGKDPKPLTQDRAIYFKILTAVWVFYFVMKAGAYFWIAENYTLEQGLLIRTIVGTGSLYVMLFISIVGSKKIFPALKRWGLLPESSEIGELKA